MALRYVAGTCSPGKGLTVFGKDSILWILKIRRRGWNCDAASAIHMYQFSSGKEGSVGSIKLKDVKLEPTSAHATSYLANWKPTDDVGRESAATYDGESTLVCSLRAVVP